VVTASRDVPKLFLDLLVARVEAPALARVLTLLFDAMTQRFLQLSMTRHGPPPVPWAWLALGSAARSELNLASDQDNGLAYDDTDDPAVDEYFRHVAREVTDGLVRCGFEEDPHGVLARRREWRMSLSEWVGVFKTSLLGGDFERMARASVAFDFRLAAGDLDVVTPLTAIVREAPRYTSFMRGLAQLGSGMRTPLGFRQRLSGKVDIKRGGLVPIQNMARYYAFSQRITQPTTLERLVAVHEVLGQDAESENSLREAFISISQLQLEHHAGAIRAGGKPDNIVDTATLSPLEKVTLQEALREVAAAQKRLPSRLEII
jgi:CBS domain-containing protein